MVAVIFTSHGSLGTKQSALLHQHVWWREQCIDLIQAYPLAVYRQGGTVEHTGGASNVCKSWSSDQGQGENRDPHCKSFKISVLG